MAPTASRSVWKVVLKSLCCFCTRLLSSVFKLHRELLNLWGTSVVNLTIYIGQHWRYLLESEWMDNSCSQKDSMGLSGRRSFAEVSSNRYFKCSTSWKCSYLISRWCFRLFLATRNQTRSSSLSVASFVSPSKQAFITSNSTCFSAWCLLNLASATIFRTAAFQVALNM